LFLLYILLIITSQIFTNFAIVNSIQFNILYKNLIFSDMR